MDARSTAFLGSRRTPTNLKPNRTSIKSWLTKCKLAVIKLIALGVDTLTINFVIIGNCINKFDAFPEHTAVSARWVSSGTTLLEKYTATAVTWRVFVSIITEHCNKDLQDID